MRNYKEFVAIFKEENDIIGNNEDDHEYITLDLNCVIGWNQADNNTISVELEGGCRYRLDIGYSEFSKMMFNLQNSMPVVL